MAAKSASSTKSVDKLLKSMLVLSQTISRVFETVAVNEAFGEHISPTKVQILRLLAMRGDRTSSQVARFLNVSKAAVSQIIDTMNQDGLVLRKPGAEDRRETYLRLSAKGRRAFNAVQRKQRNAVKAALEQFPRSSTQSWAKTLENISSALVATTDQFESFCVQCDAHADKECILDCVSTDCYYLTRQEQLESMSAAR